MPLPNDGLVIVAKRDCPTCTLIEPVFKQLADAGQPLTVYTQDDPGFPGNIDGVVDDSELEQSFHLEIEIVPTLIRMRDGREGGAPNRLAPRRMGGSDRNRGPGRRICPNNSRDAGPRAPNRACPRS